MNKVGGKIVLWGLILGMLAFTAIRTIHFLQLTFPPDQRYVAYLGLVAFDIGVLGWFYYATHSAEGASQRAIAYGMIFVCSAGVIATTIADMTLVSSQNGLAKIPPDVGTLGLWAVIIVIVLNFLAGILVHLADPTHQKHFEMQNAKDVIHATTMEHIRQQAHTIAPQIATQVAHYWAAQVTAEMTGQLPGVQPQAQLPSPVVQGTGVSLPQTGELSAQKEGFFSKIGKKLGGQQEPVCAADGTPAAAKVKGIWYCHECLDKIAANDAKPYMTSGDLKQTFTREEVQSMIAESSDRAYQAGVKYSQPPLSGPQMEAKQANHEGNNGKQ